MNGSGMESCLRKAERNSQAEAKVKGGGWEEKKNNREITGNKGNGKNGNGKPQGYIVIYLIFLLLKSSKWKKMIDRKKEKENTS